MADQPTYEEVWAQQQRLLGNEKYCAEKLNHSLEALASAKDALTRDGSTVPPEALNQLRQDVLACATKVEADRQALSSARNDISQLAWEVVQRDPQQAEWLDKNMPPSQEFRKAELMAETARDVVAMIGIATSLNMAAPQLPAHDAILTAPTQESQKEDLDKTIADISVLQPSRESMQESRDEAQKVNDTVNKALEDAPRQMVDVQEKEPQQIADDIQNKLFAERQAALEEAQRIAAVNAENERLRQVALEQFERDSRG